jgi:hypothetical protein
MAGIAAGSERAIEDAPGSIRDFALFAGEFLWGPWGRLGHSVETATC